MNRSAPRSIDEYLRQLRAALEGEDPSLIQDALYDAEEYLRAEVAAHLALKQIFVVRVGVVVGLVAHGSHPSSDSGRPGRLGSGLLNRCDGAGLRLGSYARPDRLRHGRPERARAMLRYPGRLCPEGAGRATETMFCPDSFKAVTADSGPRWHRGRR